MAKIEEVRHISPTHLATQLETHLCIHFMQSTDKHAVYGGMHRLKSMLFPGVCKLFDPKILLSAVWRSKAAM